MADPLGRMLAGGILGWLLKKDHRAEKRLEQAERNERAAIERSIRKLREEKRLLVLQRVYATLQSALSQLPCGSFDLPTLVGPAAINKMAADVTKLVSRELGRED